MGLKPYRKYNDGTDITYFMNATGERGCIVIHDTATSGTGAALDNADATVSIPTGTNGNPAGVLLCDVVNKDLTQTHLNPHKDEVQIGGKVNVARHGEVLTNMLEAGLLPVPGTAAYYTTGGLFTNNTGSSQVGRFKGSKDSDGYVKIEINIV